MRVLLVGSGGREHALAWAFGRSPALGELHAAPGNPGIAALAECHAVAADDLAGLVALARRLAPDLVVVGPEVPLVAGLADELAASNIAVFGPDEGAARIEGSKRFAKEVMRAAGVPTAEELTAARAPCVVKVDGLAAGKGVFVCKTDMEVERGLAAAARFGGDVVVEELLEGEEVSIFVLCDGHEAVPLAPARDFKRAFDGDAGSNTGGMGSFSPVPGLGTELADLVDAVHRPVLGELERRGTPFVGLLYAGLMLTDAGPRVLEFNCRFGDPETQSIVPRLDSGLLEALAAAANGELEGVALAAEGAAVTVVLAANDYPEHGDAGTPIEGLAAAEERGALVFHAGTARDGDRLVTAGGRALNVTGVGETLDMARLLAYEGASAVACPALRYRTDIAVEVEPARL